MTAGDGVLPFKVQIPRVSEFQPCHCMSSPIALKSGVELLENEERLLNVPHQRMPSCGFPTVNALHLSSGCLASVGPQAFPFVPDLGNFMFHHWMVRCQFTM